MTEAHDPHQLQPDHLPTPFTGEEIRDATPLGTTIRLLHERPGEPAWEREVRYVAVGPELATRATRRREPDGSWGEAARSESTWADLQGHASFPAATTVREAVVEDLPLGRLACLRYVARDDDDGSVATFWFARDYPGMPVRVERTVDGRLEERVSVVSKTVEPEPASTDG